jgi:hypothetical protein
MPKELKRTHWHNSESFKVPSTKNEEFVETSKAMVVGVVQ